MPCQGCRRRKAALVKQVKRMGIWMRKTPQQAKEAIVRRLRDRYGV
jgi:ABC-type nitrate/sulfonate/bicarbonate transport system substrate-binding protein